METKKTSDPRLTFPHCSKTFKQRANLTTHGATHDHEAHVKCEVCNKVLKNRVVLNVHISNQHSHRGKDSCKICLRQFSYPTSLQRHMKNIHSGKDRPRLACKFPSCTTTFLDKRDAVKHFRREHVDNPVRFRCTFCHREFKRWDNLHIHVATHTTEKPHQCATCGRSFAQANNLKRHEETHKVTSDRVRITCNLCPQKFFDNAHLRIHVKICHEDCKDYRCTFCPKRFSTSSGLKCHIEAKHNFSGILHSCDKCGYQSYSRTNLNQHVMRMHHGNGKRHNCYFCGKKFPIFSKLVRHCGRIHNLEK